MNIELDMRFIEGKHTMLDDRITYAQMATEDRLRQLRLQAAVRETKRIFQLSPRRPVRGAR